MANCHRSRFSKTTPLHELDAAFNNTVKHVQTETVMDRQMAEYAIENCHVIAGSKESLRQRPPLSSLICTIAPLAQDRDGMEAALVLAREGIPVGFMSMANAGSTGPATIPGLLAIADAEIVAALVLLQMAYPGTPVLPLVDARHHEPAHRRIHEYTLGDRHRYAIGVELAHMWGVPTLAAVFGPDAQTPGWQSAAEVAQGLC